MIGLHTQITFDGSLLQRMASNIGRAGPVVSEAAHQWALYDADPVIQANLAGLKLKRRTGHLAQSVRWSFAVQGDKVKGDLWALAYGWVHEYGPMVIRPRTARYLAIPLPAALTPAGVLRKPPRAWTNTFVRFGGFSGSGTIFQQRRNMVVPLFRLKRQVTIPQRRWAKPAVDQTLPQLKERVQKALVEALGGQGD